MRLFIISLGALITATLILIIIRFWGLSMPTYKYEHDFYSFSQTKGPVEIKVFHAIESTNKDIASKPDLILWLNSYISKDNIFVVDADSNLNKSIFDLKKDNSSKVSFKGRYLQNYTFEELQTIQPNLLKLEDVLKTYPKHKAIISINNNAEGIHKNFIELVEKLKIEKQILIHSDYDIVMKSIKEERPLYTFGTSISEIMRLKTFSTIYITPAVSMKGDALVSVLSYKNRPMVTQEIVDEVKRRQKFVFLGPLNTPEEIEAAKKFNPDGLIIN